MNKQIVENFINNNPKFEIPCGNPECNHIQVFDSNLVFENDSFTYECEKCHSMVDFNASEFIDNFNNQLQNLGFRLF